MIKFYSKQRKYEINHICPVLELKRYILINKLKFVLKKNFGGFFNKNKLNNILSRWIMCQLTKYSNNIDPLIPCNYDDIDQLKRDIINISLFDKKRNSGNADIVSEIFNKINFTSLCRNALNNIIKFYNKYYKKNTKYYTDNIISYYNNINKTIYIILTINDNIVLDKKIKKIIVSVPYYTYKKIIKLYVLKNDYNKKYFFSKLVICLTLRYYILESYNQQAAVIDSFYKIIKKKYNTTLELFASPFNTYLSSYCSLFNDIEQYFNSKGNFIDIKFVKGFYVANPPFDEDIMNFTVDKILTSLNESRENLTFLMVLPAWDDAKYGDFYALRKIKESKYLKFIRLINKNDSSFINYSTFKILNLCSVYLIILQNNYYSNKYVFKKDDPTLNNLIDKYWMNCDKKRRINNVKKVYIDNYKNLDYYFLSNTEVNDAVDYMIDLNNYMFDLNH